MYYPYMRGRQFELIALREFALQSDYHHSITPIIEPVRNSFNSLKIALPLFKKGGMKFALVLNPHVGEIKTEGKIQEELQAEIEDLSTWIPAFILDSNFETIAKQIGTYGYHDIMIICSESTDSNSEEFLSFIDSQPIRYIVTKENRSLKRKLYNKNVRLIRFDDNFNNLKRNSDYLLTPDEKFTEEHLFYSEDGYHGFADYTVLSSQFTEGGAMPYAVAIHLTYEKENSEIWIKHFVSSSNGDRSNIQGKFAEAAQKAVEFLNAMDIQNNASNELREYYEKKLYPGLGMLKKISIKNHLETINKVLEITN